MLLITNDKKEIEVNDDIFNYGYNEGLVHQAVVQFMNAQRSGTVAQKTRSEVRGGGKKPWKQKGTGRARAGTIRSPLWRGGGVTFAAKPRDYTQKLNKKMYVRALRSILSELYRTNRLLIVTDFKCDTFKTKNFIKNMTALGVQNALVIAEEVSDEMYMSSRNLPNFAVCDVDCVDPYNLIRFENIVITQNAIKLLEQRLQ